VLYYFSIEAVPTTKRSNLKIRQQFRSSDLSPRYRAKIEKG
jgi:hypothetical protein